MNKTDLIELIRSGEDSTLEFKRDDIPNYDLAKALVAFLNLEGGTVLLGVEDDGRISGTSRERLDEWVAELCRVKIEPPIVPLLSWARDAGLGRDVLAIRVTRGPDKPYACVHGGRRTYYIRVSNTSREASREELERMYQASGRLHYGLKPTPGAGLEAFDLRRLRLPDLRPQRDRAGRGRSWRLGEATAEYGFDVGVGRATGGDYRWLASFWNRTEQVPTAIGHSRGLFSGY